MANWTIMTANWLNSNKDARDAAYISKHAKAQMQKTLCNSSQIQVNNYATKPTIAFKQYTCICLFMKRLIGHKSFLVTVACPEIAKARLTSIAWFNKIIGALNIALR